MLLTTNLGELYRGSHPRAYIIEGPPWSLAELVPHAIKDYQTTCP